MSVNISDNLISVILVVDGKPVLVVARKNETGEVDVTFHYYNEKSAGFAFVCGVTGKKIPFSEKSITSYGTRILEHGKNVEKMDTTFENLLTREANKERLAKIYSDFTINYSVQAREDSWPKREEFRMRIGFNQDYYSTHFPKDWHIKPLAGGFWGSGIELVFDGDR